MFVRSRAPWSAWLLALPALLAVAATLRPGSVAAQGDPLPSWKDGAAKQAIFDFVGRVTHIGTDDFVPPAERVAVFDDDGTLWPEQPISVQLAFAVERARALASEHPDWKTRAPFQAALSGEAESLAALSPQQVLEMIAETRAGSTVEAFSAAVKDWLASAKHPRFGKLYTELTYQPMVELVGYLRAEGFKCFLVSASDADFVRASAETLYGIPAEQVVASRSACDFRVGSKGETSLVELARVESVVDGDARPVAIHQQIGRRPILAFGNSDGDLAMLRWTFGGAGPRWVGLVHHTDGAREWEYDREAKRGRLAAALDEAAKQGWTVADMAKDWKRVFAFE